MPKLIMIELNEVNFDYVRRYVEKGALPNLARLIETHGIIETTSETEYDYLEPWIQWVTAHTGQTQAEHGLFRLGDVVDHPELRQIWETLEDAGFSVGAISPMNAHNSCRSPAFFVPDPWTRTRVSGNHLVRQLYGAIAQLVNDNAEGKVDRSSLGWLAAGLVRYARLTNYGDYIKLGSSIRKPWCRALLLDLLLSDLFTAELKRTQADFATLFLNAAAHLQHHYLFNSTVYDGNNINPAWYIAKDQDPILEVYTLYDDIIGRVSAQFPDHRMLIATGLHQDPYHSTLYYWRLRNHQSFLDEIGVACDRVEPRMSRDFVVYAADRTQMVEAKRKLEEAVADDGQRLFDIDDRGDSLFVMLVYGSDIPADLGYRVGNRHFTNLAGKTAFVAIKNGEHNGIGYLVDTGRRPGEQDRIALTAVHQRIVSHFGLA